MRRASLASFAVAAFWLTGVEAQNSAEGIPAELLCDQCPWDAPVRIRRDDFSVPNAATVVTAEDMRSLGVISVADMVNQLPNGTGAESVDGADPEARTPVNLGATIERLERGQPGLAAPAESNGAAADEPSADAAASSEDEQTER